MRATTRPEEAGRTKSNHLPPLPRTICEPSTVLNSRLRSPALKAPDEPSAAAPAAAAVAADSSSACCCCCWAEADDAFFFLLPAPPEPDELARLPAPSEAFDDDAADKGLADSLDGCASCGWLGGGGRAADDDGCWAPAAVVQDDDEWGCKGDVSSEEDGWASSDSCWSEDWGAAVADGGRRPAAAGRADDNVACGRANASGSTAGGCCELESRTALAASVDVTKRWDPADAVREGGPDGGLAAPVEAAAAAASAAAGGAGGWYPAMAIGLEGSVWASDGGSSDDGWPAVFVRLADDPC